MTWNTITIRLRRPEVEIEAVAKPNVNAWVNKLIVERFARKHGGQSAALG